MINGAGSIVDIRREITCRLRRRPYDSILYILRALSHLALQYPDLAAGDAYKALLLTDEANDESAEYHEQAREPIDAWLHSGILAYGPSLFIFVRHILDPDIFRRLEKVVGVEDVAALCCSVIVTALLRCGCYKSANDYCSRGRRLQPDEKYFEKYSKEIRRSASMHLADASLFDEKVHLSDRGVLVRREVYPWNEHEPDRYAAQSLSFLNERLSAAAPKCEVRAVDLPMLTASGAETSPETITQLGMFAKQDIEPGEVVLEEYSLLTANNRLHDPLCDACSSPLPGLPDEIYACEECDDTVFCSSRCRDAALASYHPAICGKDVDAVGKDTSAQDAADALYLLLLGRTFALSESQGVHPLDLAETKYLWGGFNHSSAARLALPFSFEHFVLQPLHILEKMDIDIFRALDKYDFWIFNTLYAKFRGVASARLSLRDGRPEVCAVHPLWCLANHSCSPNVKWQWGGEIKFWARTEDEKVAWESDGDKRTTAGIRAGEEILNHYCDIELDVKSRREWAAGALGGECVCDRCTWEAKQSGLVSNRNKAH